MQVSEDEVYARTNSNIVSSAHFQSDSFYTRRWNRNHASRLDDQLIDHYGSNFDLRKFYRFFA